MTDLVDHRVSGRADGPVVVLANSLGSTWGLWDGVLPALEDSFRVVRFDTRGHGRSPVPAGPYAVDDLADDLAALLDHLDVERAHVVGLSLGGMTAMALASRRPERVDRLVLVCTSAFLPPPQGWLDRAAAVRAGGGEAIAETVVARWFTADLRAARPDVEAAAEAMVSATPREGYAACCEAIAAMDLRGRLADIAAPVLAIAGADDPATPPEHLAAIADGVPDGRLVVLDDAAHLAAWEQPDAVAAAILDHLLPSRQLTEGFVA